MITKCNLRKKVLIMLLSDNAYNEFKKGLCACFSKDKKKAVVTTKEEAEKHKEDIDKHVNERESENNINVEDALGSVHTKKEVIY